MQFGACFLRVRDGVKYQRNYIMGYCTYNLQLCNLSSHVCLSDILYMSSVCCGFIVMSVVAVYRLYIV